MAVISTFISYYWQLQCDCKIVLYSSMYLKFVPLQCTVC